MTEQVTTPTLFTTPPDRPALDRELLAVLHESTAPLDVDAIHQEVNIDNRAHVAKGPLEVLIQELVKAGKIAEVAHGQPARPHFVLVAEVREQLDGSWTRAKALAAMVVVLGEPSNPVTIQECTDTLAKTLMRVDGAVAIPLPLLSALAAVVDVNNPEAVDAMVAVQLDSLVRAGMATMVAPPAVAISDSSNDTADEAAPKLAPGDDTTTADDVAAPANTAETETTSQPNLHACQFALSAAGWEKFVNEGALVVSLAAFPDLARQSGESANEARDLKRRLDELQREFDVHREVSTKLNVVLKDDNTKLRTEQGRFLAFCEDKGIDFALAVNNASNERVRERHTVHAILDVKTLSELIGERTKANRYAEALEERVKDQTALGKANVKEAKTRVESLDQIIAMAESGLGSPFDYEKMCVKRLQKGHIVWESDEPHDKGRIVEVEPITSDSPSKEERKGNAKPTQLAMPGTAKSGELEWHPGDPPPVGSVEGDVAPPATPVEPSDNDVLNPAPTPSTEPTSEETSEDDGDGDDIADDEDGDEDEGDDEDEDGDGASEDDSAEAAPVINGKRTVDAVSAKAFIRSHLKGGRKTLNECGTAYAESIGQAGKARVVKYGADIAEQLVSAGELESETVGESCFVWLKATTDEKPPRARKKKVN